MSKYLPEGCTDDDLPGYWETDCPDCADCEVFDEHCPTCDGTGVIDQRDLDANLAEHAAIAAAENRAEEARHG